MFINQLTAAEKAVLLEALLTKALTLRNLIKDIEVSNIIHPHSLWEYNKELEVCTALISAVTDYQLED